MKNYQLKEKLICLHNVVGGYGDKVVLNNINLTEQDVVIDGEITGQSYAFLGRSGRGKSTLFKLLTGLMAPKSGQVLINNISDGIENTAKVVGEGDISFVDQKYTLFRHKKVVDILLYSLRKDTRPKAEKLVIIDELLKEWDLLPHKDKYSCELSGGQRQRTAILSKILTNNTFLVLDEPTSGLDPVAIRKVKGYIKKFKETNEMNTVMFSTHDINFAVEMADVIYILGFENPDSEVSTILHRIDMKERGLAWSEFGGEHVKVVNEILDLMENS